MKRRVKDFLVVIPLHLPLGYPADYIDQTADILKKRNKVVLFDFQYPYAWKKILRFKNLHAFFQSVIKILKRENLAVYFRSTSILPFQRNNFLYKVNVYLGILQLKVLLFLSRKKVILWGFDPVLEKVVGKIREKISVYDCIDFLAEDEETKHLKPLEEKLFSKVNLIAFNSSPPYQEKVKRYPDIKKKSIVTYCGCATQLFQDSSSAGPAEIKKIKGKKIIFAGVFDYRVDTNLLNYIVKKNPRLHFIFIGPVRKTVGQGFFNLLRQKNLIYLDEKDKNLLPAYLKHSNLGIIPYNTKFFFTKYSNPMKAYEYLASGLPVVSTKILALDNYPKDIVYTTDKSQEFSRAINRLIKNWDDNKVKKAKKIAEENSWKNKVAKIEKSILTGLDSCIS